MGKKHNLFLGIAGGLMLALAGCAGVQSAADIPAPEIGYRTPTPLPTVPTSTAHPSTLALPAPVNELDDRSYGWRQPLARDAIRPIYDPEFAPADDAPYNDNELVIGLEINGDARAYAIGPLNQREMVNDTVGGVPVLVAW